MFLSSRSAVVSDVVLFAQLNFVEGNETYVCTRQTIHICAGVNLSTVGKYAKFSMADVIGSGDDGGGGGEWWLLVLLLPMGIKLFVLLYAVESFLFTLLMLLVSPRYVRLKWLS